MASLAGVPPTYVANAFGDDNSDDNSEDGWPINIAGVRAFFTTSSNYKMSYFSDSDGSKIVGAKIKKFTKQGIPIIAAGEGIRANAASGNTWLAEEERPHTFLIIGRTSEKVAVVIDSTKREKAKEYRVKFVNIDKLIAGINKKGVNDDYKKRIYYSGSGGSNGGIAVWKGIWSQHMEPINDDF